jgi:oligopeptide/dipeptide ABC transporter ATP-binding protein
MNEPVLESRDLRAFYATRQGRCMAVDGVSFRIARGENLGLVGESGCGKSTVIRAIIKVHPRNFHIESGKVFINGRDVVPLSYEEMRAIRWKEVALIPQSAMNALNPVYKVGYQIQEAILEHEDIPPREAMGRVRELFSLVGIDSSRIAAYPHQFSGGMRQRANIAMALALRPSLLIADEPTTALDVLVQDQIFQRILRLQKEMDCSMLLVTHDISLVAENCDWMAVMYAGRIVEYGPVARVFKGPCHPYTLGLKNAFPSINRPRDQPLISIPKSPPSLIDPPEQCRFCARCPFSTEICWEVRPKSREVEEGHSAACHHLDRIEDIRIQAARGETWNEEALPGPPHRREDRTG